MKRNGILGTITWLYGIIVIILALLSLFESDILLINFLRYVIFTVSIPFVIIGIIAMVIGSNRNRAINGLIFIFMAYLIPILDGFYK